MSGARPWLTAKTGGPKGFASYTPRGWKAGIEQDVLLLIAELEEADALPVGPRTVGYRLSMRENVSGLRYVKTNYGADGRPSERVVPGFATFKDVEDMVKRLRQAERLDWDAISDGSAVEYPVAGSASLEKFLAELIEHPYQRDLRQGQPVVVEIYSESAELTPLIRRVAAEYGVRVYSGRGSGGPDVALGTAISAWNRSLYHQRTLIFGIGDLDYDGVAGVMRPHVEHVGQFLGGIAERQGGDPEDTARMLDFRRIAITPEQAITIAEGLNDPLGVYALRAYRDSGGNDWERDADLLKFAPKTEVEALDPVALQDLIRAEIEDILDLDLIRSLRDQETSEGEWLKAELRSLRDRLCEEREERP